MKRHLPSLAPFMPATTGIGIDPRDGMTTVSRFWF
jgi:hypothetical protein